MLEGILIILLGGILRISPAIAIASIGDCLTQRTGGFNIGLEGIIPCGAVATIMVLTAAENVYLAVFVAAVVGMVFSFIYAYLCSLPKVNEIAIGIAFLLFGTALAQFLGSNYINETSQVIYSIDTMNIANIENNALVKVAIFLLPIILIAVFINWMFNNTKFGLLLKAAGSRNGDKAIFVSGFNIKFIRILATSLGGLFAGVAGAHLVIFYPGGWSDQIATGVGITAITLTFIAKGDPIKTLMIVIIFAAIASLGLVMQATFGTSYYHILNVLPYIFALIILILNRQKMKFN